MSETFFWARQGLGLPSNTADIIREASKSPLGVLALIILLVALLAIRFFPPGKSSQRTRASMFAMIFGGVLLFGFAISKSLDVADIVRVKVIVLDTRGIPADEVKVWSSLGGEAKRVAGGWEFDIPSSGIPAGRQLDIFASQDSDFLTGHSSLLITKGQNFVTTLSLERKETTVQGRVIDERGKGIESATVSVDGFPGEGVETDGTGNFIANAHAAEHQPVALHVEKKGFKSADQEHFAGKDPATITLMKQ